MVKQTAETCLDNRHIRSGKIDDKYLVQAYIGGGGTACVFQVRTQDDPHTYALKLLQDDYFRSSFVLEQFRLEAERLLQLNHPNIVRFYDFAIRDEYAYLLMEQIKGTALSDFLRNLRAENRYFPVNEVVRTLTQTSRALRYLHDNALIHRDVKASNILIEQHTGKVYLVDFGIATEASEAATAFNAGTRSYMPPEQQENLGITLDYRADIYAFGIVTYEMLANRRPFGRQPHLSGREAEQDLIRQHREDPPPSLADQRPDLPPGVDAVIAKALAKRPEARYDSVRAFIEELHAVLTPQLSPDLLDLDEITALDPLGSMRGALRQRVQEDLTPTGSAAPMTAPTVASPATQAREGGSRGMIFGAVLLVGLLLVSGIAVLALGGGNGNPDEDEAEPAIARVTDEATEEIAQVLTATPQEEVAGGATSEPDDEDAPPQDAGTPASEPESDNDNTQTPQITAPPDETATPEATASPTPTLTATPTLTPTPTATATATATLTPTASLTPTLTPTPVPTTFLADQVFAILAQDGAALGLDAPLPEALALLRAETDAFIPLQLGAVDGFRAMTELSNTAAVTRYGFAYRVQDAQNYLRFTLTPASSTWQLEQIEAGEPTLVDSGQVESGALNSLTLMAVGPYLRAEVGETIIEAQADRWTSGQVGLWVEMVAPDEPFPVTALRVGLAGSREQIEALAAAPPTPLPNIQLIDFLLQDVEALLATGDVATLTVDCLRFVDVYEGLERHMPRGEALQIWAQRAIDNSALIYNGCQIDVSIDGLMDMSAAVNDFITWQDDLSTLRDEIESAPPS